MIRRYAYRFSADSGLTWTVVHAVRLTNGPITARAKTLPDTATLRMSDTISRADVAAWLLSAAADQTTCGRAVVLAA